VNRRGVRLCAVSPLNRTTTIREDAAANCLSGCARPYQYDRLGQLTNVTDDLAHVTDRYDLAGREAVDERS
jgi:hypothetical protein